MTDFKLRHGHIYLFRLRNGKRKLGYGQSPEDARKILSWRLTPAEMAEIVEEDPEVIQQADLQQHVKELG